MAKTEFIWDVVTDNVMMEKDGAGNTQAVYTQEPYQYGRLISQRRGNQTTYYHYDGNGNTRALTDAGENVTDTYTYTAFGDQVATTGTTPNRYRYAGQYGYQHNEKTADYYVRARVYEPTRGRWASTDPISSNEQYRYADNSPVNLVDPSGLREVPISALRPFEIDRLRALDRLFGELGVRHFRRRKAAENRMKTLLIALRFSPARSWCGKHKTVADPETRFRIRNICTELLRAERRRRRDMVVKVCCQETQRGTVPPDYGEWIRDRVRARLREVNLLSVPNARAVTPWVLVLGDNAAIDARTKRETEIRCGCRKQANKMAIVNVALVRLGVVVTQASGRFVIHYRYEIKKPTFAARCTEPLVAPRVDQLEI